MKKKIFVVDDNEENLSIFAHYGYGFYGYKGTSIVRVAANCESVGDNILY